MAATQRDNGDDERWQLMLDGIGEVSQRHRDLLRSMQSGFNSLGTELDTLRLRLARIERMLFWGLVSSVINNLGWIGVAALLAYGLARLFSVT